MNQWWPTVYHKKYAHGFCFAVLCCGYTLTDFPISIRLTSLALWQSNDCPSASKATLMNMDKYFMWIHYERLHNHNKAKHNKTVCIFLGIYRSLLTAKFVDVVDRKGLQMFWKTRIYTRFLDSPYPPFICIYYRPSHKQDISALLRQLVMESHLGENSDTSRT